MAQTLKGQPITVSELQQAAAGAVAAYPFSPYIRELRDKIVEATQ